MAVEFHAGYMITFDGHMNECKHHDRMACTCTKIGLEDDIKQLQAEFLKNEKILSSLELNNEQMRIEVARLRASIKWQYQIIDNSVVKPILET